MKKFNTLSELIAEWEVNGACKEGVEFNKSCRTLQEVFDNCPHNFRLWRLNKGYLQFAEKCEWSKLDGCDWRHLLSKQPTFADKCEWSKLEGWDWSKLFSSQPTFAEKCEWSKLDGCDWRHLLTNHPQFADKCEWSKIDGWDWSILISKQPQFAKYRTN